MGKPVSTGLFVRSDGTSCEITPRNKKFSLKELQALVGGYIERVDLGDGIDMIVNEEGRLIGLPVNPGATMLAGRLIVGNVLVVLRKLW